MYTPPAETRERGVRTIVRRIFHTVQRGETLASIAKRYKVGIDDLKRWNQIGRLFAGQKLAIERETTIAVLPRKAAASVRPHTKRPIRSRG